MLMIMTTLIGKNNKYIYCVTIFVVPRMKLKDQKRNGQLTSAVLVVKKKLSFNQRLMMTYKAIHLNFIHSFKQISIVTFNYVRSSS